MSDWRIRKAALSDASALSALGKQTFRETFTHYPDEAALTQHLDEYYSPDVFAGYLHNPKIHVWVAEYGGQLIGTTQLGPYKLPLKPENLPVIELHRLYVLKSWHGKKIGAALMEKSLETARHEAAKSLYLGVWEKNYPAQAFYARYGFEKVGEYNYPPIGNTVDREWILRLCL